MVGDLLAVDKTTNEVAGIRQVAGCRQPHAVVQNDTADRDGCWRTVPGGTTSRIRHRRVIERSPAITSIRLSAEMLPARLSRRNACGSSFS
jgi:hypothetical protein